MSVSSPSLALCLILLGQAARADDPVVEIVPQIGHRQSILCIAFSPDGKYVASGGADHALMLWEVSTGRQVRRFAVPDIAVWSAAFSPDGKHIVTAGSGNAATLWETTSEAAIRTFEPPARPAIARHADSQLDHIFVAFRPGSRQVLTGLKDGSVILWDVETAQPVRKFEGGASIARCAALSTDGKFILTGSTEGKASLSDATTGNHIISYGGGLGPVTAVAFSPDGKRVVTAGENGALCLWERDNAQQVRQSKEHQGAILDAAFNPDGTQIVTGSNDGTAILWDAVTLRRIRRLRGHSGRGVSSIFGPDGSLVLTAASDGTLVLWDANSGKRLRVFEANGTHLAGFAVNSPGTHLLARFWSHPYILWDLAAGKSVRTFGDSLWSYGQAVTLNRDASRAATASRGGADVWDTRTGALLFHAPVGGGKFPSAWSAAFSPQEDHLLAADFNSFFLWNSVTRKIVRAINSGEEREAEPASGQCVAFHPDGHEFLSAADSPKGDPDGFGAMLWNVETGTVVRVMRGHGGTVENLAFSIDGKFAVTGSEDQTAIIWNVATGERVHRLTGHRDAVRAVAFSPDGRFVLTGSADRRAILWDAVAGKEILTLSPHLGEVTGVAFAAGSTIALTASEADGALHVWSIASGKELARCHSLDEGEEWLVYTPEGLLDHSDGAGRFVVFRVPGTNTVTSDASVFRRNRRPGLLAKLLRGEPVADQPVK
jgi:WD40 repeat protein